MSEKKKSSSPTLKYSLKSRDYEVLLRLSSSIQRMKMFDCNDERVVTLLNNEQATGRQKKQFGNIEKKDSRTNIHTIKMDIIFKLHI